MNTFELSFMEPANRFTLYYQGDDVEELWGTMMQKTIGTVVVGSSSGGAPVDPDDYFQTVLRLSELDTQQKKTEARQNMGVEVIDLGTFN